MEQSSSPCPAPAAGAGEGLPPSAAGEAGIARTLMSRFIRIVWHSRFVSAYLRRFLSRIMSGRDSRILCGPVEGRGAKTPVSLSSIQCLGALSRFMCFFGPRAILRSVC